MVNPYAQSIRNLHLRLPDHFPLIFNQIPQAMLHVIPKVDEAVLVTFHNADCDGLIGAPAATLMGRSFHPKVPVGLLLHRIVLKAKKMDEVLMALAQIRFPSSHGLAKRGARVFHLWFDPLSEDLRVIRLGVILGNRGLLVRRLPMEAGASYNYRLKAQPSRSSGC